MHHRCLPVAVAAVLLAPGWSFGAGARDPRPPAWPCHTLRAESVRRLNAPDAERFDASGLLLTAAGPLLTLNDRGASLYRIDLTPGGAEANLIRLPDCFTSAQLAAFRDEKTDRYDCEGLAEDAAGRIYVCEETDRWILRFDPQTRKVERLPIDWSPVKKYFAEDPNASWEGIAIGDDRLYVANERETGRIIVVDLATLKVVDHFAVHPWGREARDVHYTDLAWFEGALFVLLRESSVVLQVNPRSHRVLAEFSFRDVEQEPNSVYYNRYPTSTMEGLAVNADWIWLVTDNNGLGRVKDPDDLRPTLFQCRRPAAPAAPPKE